MQNPMLSSLACSVSDLFRSVPRDPLPGPWTGRRERPSLQPSFCAPWCWQSARRGHEGAGCPCVCHGWTKARHRRATLAWSSRVDVRIRSCLVRRRLLTFFDYTQNLRCSISDLQEPRLTLSCRWRGLISLWPCASPPAVVHQALLAVRCCYPVLPRWSLTQPPARDPAVRLPRSAFRTMARCKRGRASWLCDLRIRLSPIIQVMPSCVLTR